MEGWKIQTKRRTTEIIFHLKKSFIIVFFVLAGFVFESSGQQATVFGTIRSEEDEVIHYANLAVKGTTLGTTTAKDGTFSLPIPANQTVTILISFIGYERDSAVVNLVPGEKKEINIILKQIATELKSI
jgi:hypothetical protein